MREPPFDTLLDAPYKLKTLRKGSKKGVGKMEKPAETRFPAQELISRRWSPRAFSDELPSWEDLGAMLEAARWAPSCFNGQPWRFIIARRDQKDFYDRALGCLREKNQLGTPGARNRNTGYTPGLRIQRKTKPVGQLRRGLAMAQFIIQAEALGYSVHVMAGVLRGKANRNVSTLFDIEPRNS